MIKARVVWGKANKNHVDVEFAYPLKEGDTFVLGTEDDRQICKVDTVMHAPVNAGSGDVASVLYGVTMTSTKRYWRSLSTWSDVLGSMLKK